MKRKISWMLILLIVFTSLSVQVLTDSIKVSAAEDIINWNKNDTLDIYLDIVENKVSDDEILLELDMENTGSHELFYYLEDSRKTIVEFVQASDYLNIFYRVEDKDGNSITQDLVDKSYREVDYTKEVAEWEYVSGKTVSSNGELEYTIDGSVSNKYPGVAFEVDNKMVIIRWDSKTGKVYYLLNKYSNGNIMPVSFKNPLGNIEKINILNGLENFTVEPTHIKSDGGVNKDYKSLAYPEDDENPGTRPGLKISFKQPKEFDEINWVYDYSTSISDINAIVEIQDISSDAYLDFNFNLTATGGSIESLPSNNPSGANYSYDSTDSIYTINIVKDKTTLVNQNDFIQWDELESSKIYNVSISLEKPIDGSMSEYEFKQYLPIGNFAYTYLEYKINRANMSEAYLDIVPYDIDSGDEIEYLILYSKVLKEDLDEDDDLWVKHYYSSGEDEENIYIPVPFNKESDKDVYQIVIKFTDNSLKSQLLNYKASEDKNIPLTTPRIKDIENLYVIPPEDETSEYPSKIQFDLIWEAPDNDEFFELDTIFQNIDGNSDNDAIYYELLVNDVPTDSDENPFNTIKIFKVTKDGDKYKVEDVYNKAEPSQDTNYEDGYNEDDGLFKMENICIYENSEWAKIIETTLDEENDVYDIPDESTLTKEYDFEFPGVNYIRIRAITEIDGKYGVSYNSLPVSLSLSMTKIDVPIPDSLSYYPVNSSNQGDPIGIELIWEPIDIEMYENYMLEPVDKVITDIDYYIYVSMNKDDMIEFDTSGAQEVSINADGENLTVDDSILDMLRSGEMIYFIRNSNKDESSTLISNIMGLDENENYYIRIIAKLNIDDGGTVEERKSEPSAILSVTTPTIPKDPKEDEIKPLAVENLEASFLNDDGLQGTLTWNFSEEITIGEDEYGFEILSIEDRSLPSNLSSSEITISEILESEYFENDKLEAWRIYNESGTIVLKKYNNETGSWENQDSSLFTISENEVYMIDSDNSPNVVNYYYVRTIDIEGGNVKAASVWQVDTLTTAPISGPINLTVVYDSEYSYDETTESIIRFDAPIPYDADLETEYVMEIYVKGEEDSDYTSTKYDVTFLEKNENGPLGYTRLLYRISDLKPGKSYNVRVRIEDRTKEIQLLPDGTYGYPKSPYSEKITIRTEFDQDSYEQEMIYQDYLDYFDKRIEELKRMPYFIVEDNKKTHTKKYRDEFSIGELSVNKNGIYKLYTTETEYQIFYLPADFIETANDYNVTIQISYKNQEISIRPKSIGINITDEIEHIVDEINEYGSDLSDYFIQISVNIDNYSSKILSKTPLSDLIDLEIEVIGSEKSEEDLDEMILYELDIISERIREDLTLELEDELEEGAKEEELLEIVERAIDEVIEEHMEETEEILDDYFDETISIDELEKNMQIKLTPYEKGTSASTYYMDNGNWKATDGFYYNNSYLMDVTEISSYILLPVGSSYSNITPIYSNEEIDVITKYNLSDIFSSMQIELSEGGFYRYRLIEVLATVLGNNTGDFTDNKNYLKNLGITVPTSNKYGIVTVEEGLYLCTQVYSLKQNINLKTIQIKDYNIIEDINDVNPKFKETLIIGANIGLFELDNGFLYPDKDLSIQELIDLLTKIDQGVTW